MLIGIFGDMGSGKTLYMTYYTLKYYVEDKLYERAFANYHIKSPNKKRPVELLTFEAFKALGKTSEALVCLDEAYIWLDSRMSGTKRNRQISYLVLQSRKRGFDIAYTAQAQSSIDLRMRRFTEIKVLAEKRENGFKYVELFGNKVRERFLPFKQAEKIYPYYDTKEIVDFGKLMD